MRSAIRFINDGVWLVVSLIVFFVSLFIRYVFGRGR